MLDAGTCLLRPLERGDFATTLAWHRDRDLRNAVLGYPFPVTEEGEAQWYEQALADQSRRAATFAICADGDHAALGLVRLSGIDWIVRSAEFSIVIGNAASRGKGIGRAATERLIAYGFDDLNLNRIYLRVTAENLAAIKLYEGLGFQQEGVCRQHAFVDGALVDIVMMALLREEWSSRPKGRA